MLWQLLLQTNCMYQVKFLKYQNFLDINYSKNSRQGYKPSFEREKGGVQTDTGIILLGIQPAQNKRKGQKAVAV